jgi:hypothetical protein
LKFTRAAETLFPTTPIRNIIFKLVKWGHISDLIWICLCDIICFCDLICFYMILCAPICFLCALICFLCALSCFYMLIFDLSVLACFKNVCLQITRYVSK